MLGTLNDGVSEHACTIGTRFDPFFFQDVPDRLSAGPLSDAHHHMLSAPEMLDPFAPNLKHKTDVLVRERIPNLPCELNYRPPSQAWSVATGLVLPWLVGAAGVGIVWGVVFRHPATFGLLLS